MNRAHGLKFPEILNIIHCLIFYKEEIAIWHGRSQSVVFNAFPQNWGYWYDFDWYSLNFSGFNEDGDRHRSRSLSPHESFSPRSRSRSPIIRTHSPRQTSHSPPSRKESPKENFDRQRDEEKPLDSYSASLRLASLETLTGKSLVSSLPPTFPFPPMPMDESTSVKVPSSPTPSLPEALANLQTTANQSYASLMGSPIQQLLSGGPAGLSGLPKPSDLIQQAQALQLLAHLQTMLMNPNASNSQSPSISSPLSNATNFQKVWFIHLSIRV